MKKLKKLKLHDLEASCDLLSPFEQKRIMGGKDDIFDIQGGRIAEQNGGVLLTTTDGYSCFFDGVRLTDDWVIGETAYQLNGMIHNPIHGSMPRSIDSVSTIFSTNSGITCSNCTTEAPLAIYTMWVYLAAGVA